VPIGRGQVDGKAGRPIDSGMSVFPGWELPGTPNDGPDDEITLFARIEGLIGEEAALLAIPARERTNEEDGRLRRISDELDRIWESLRRRAESRHAGGTG
jgi:hypothetical protein